MGIPLNIDWQQILLHLFNFLLLAGGLYLLLYKPVRDFMESRKAYYAGLEEAAKAEKAAAEQEHAHYTAQLDAARDEIDRMKKDAMETARQEIEAQMEEARNKQRELLLKTRAEANQEKEKILAEANAQIESMVYAAMDKLIVPAGTDPLDDFLDRAQKEG